MVLFKRFTSNKSKRNRNKGKRNVTFDDDTDVTHVDLYDNVEEIWYSKEDMVKFKQRDQHIVNHILTKKIIDPSLLELRRMLLEESPRGLEYAQPGKLKIQNRRRLDSIASVVNVQLVFQDLTDADTAEEGLCIDDLSDEIAKIYSARCETAVDEALAIASNDAQYVRNYVRTTSNAKISNDDKEEAQSNSTANSSSSSRHHHHRFFRATLLNRKDRKRTHPNE